MIKPIRRPRKQENSRCEDMKKFLEHLNKPRENKPNQKSHSKTRSNPIKKGVYLHKNKKQQLNLKLSIYKNSNIKFIHHQNPNHNFHQVLTNQGDHGVG